MQTGKTRCVILGRVSTDDQAREGTSLDEQVRKLSLYAEAMGYDLVDTYLDDISGAKALADRPQGARLLADARAKKFDKVLCTSVDRFSRSLSAGSSDMETLKELGVSIFFQQIGQEMSESVDTEGHIGQMIIGMLLLFADFERSMIRSRTHAGNMAAAEADRILPGRLPYGVESDDEGQLHIIEEEAEAVRAVFKMRAQGESLTAITRWLNESKYDQRPVYSKAKTMQARQIDPDAPEVFTDGTWRKPTVVNMLTQPAYVGTYAKQFGGKQFAFKVAPIIDEETWDKVQTIQTKVTPIRKRQGVKKRHYALSGRIFHEHGPDDLVKMFGRTMKGKTIYRCYSAQSSDASISDCPGLGMKSGHSSTKVDAGRVEGLTLLWMLEALSDADEWASYLEHADNTLEKAGAAPDDLDAYQEHVNELEAQLSYIDSRGITLAAERGPEYAAKWAAEKSEPVKESLTLAQAALDRIKDAQTWRKGLEKGLAGLMAVEVDWSPEAKAEWMQQEGYDLATEALENLHPVLESGEGSNQWYAVLREEGQRGLLGQGISRWASEWTRHIADFLNAKVVLSERTSPDDLPDSLKDEALADVPQVHVDFAPAAGLQTDSVSWALLDLNQ